MQTGDVVTVVTISGEYVGKLVSQEDSAITIDNPRMILSNPQDGSMGFGFDDGEVDALYTKAVNIVIEQQKVSTSYIQRYLQIGYNRAARIVDMMEAEGVVSKANHVGKRDVL